MRCHLGFFPNSSGNKAAANLRPKMFMVNLKTFQPHAIVTRSALTKFKKDKIQNLRVQQYINLLGKTVYES